MPSFSGGHGVTFESDKVHLANGKLGLSDNSLYAL